MIIQSIHFLGPAAIIVFLSSATYLLILKPVFFSFFRLFQILCVHNISLILPLLFGVPFPLIPQVVFPFLQIQKSFFGLLSLFESQVNLLYHIYFFHKNLLYRWGKRAQIKGAPAAPGPGGRAAWFETSFSPLPWFIRARAEKRH